MKRTALASVVLTLVAAWVPGAGPQAPRQPKTHQVRLNGHTFTLPLGFEIELVAGPPLVDRPIEADFDERGRLYVTDSSGSNEPVGEQLKKKPHRVLRLEDTHGTGRYDRRTVFANRMMFPEGAMWMAGALYVSAAPSIWKLTDTDGDGVADQRVEWFQGKTLTGCANDLHGPYAGPDGWIYWCKGAFARQTYERPPSPLPSPPGGEGKGEGRRRPFVTRAAHIFRCRPDGTGIEPVMSGGMDNPVEVVFTRGGERIFTTTFFQHPGGGLRDGLVHAIYGGVYGKDHDPIHEHPWTSPHLMPVLTHLGAAAPCGLIRYESAVFGAEYRDNLFACLFNMHKVTRHVLVPDGATFRTRDADFLVSDNLDFHPTDVLEDADGSLLVIDTGGWYKLCCPTSQLHKPDVLGAIYRIRRQGAEHVEDPRGLKLAWSDVTAEDLTRRLQDRRAAVRRRAVAALAARGKEAIAALPDLVPNRAGSGEMGCDAVWAATRIDRADARALVRRALEDGDETVRQAALHSISLWRDREAVPALLRVLHGTSLHNRRAAAEALGRIGDSAAVPALLEAVGKPTDRALEHSLTYALTEIGDRAGAAAGLRSANALTRRAALTALDQMEGGRLDAATVARELTAADPKLKETAWWIAGRHPEWGGHLAGFLRARLAAKDLAATQREELVHQLARFAGAAPVRALLTERLRAPAASAEARRTVLRAMAEAGLKEAPAAWVMALTPLLATDDRGLLREAVGTAQALRLPKQGAGGLVEALLKIGKDAHADADLRLRALAAVPAGVGTVEPALFDFLHSMVGADQPVAARGMAADVLARAKLNRGQLIRLADTLSQTAPTELDRLLEAFTQSADEKVGLRLVACLKDPHVRSSLRVDLVKPRLAGFGAAVQKEAAELYAALDADMAKQRARLEQLLTSLKGGDVRRGQAVFNSSKASCSACHAIGYLGGNVGPDLTQIGRIRSERDLLESIVFPSASIVRSYEPVLISTKAGKFYNGVIRKESPDEVVLATGPNQEVRLARADIEDVQPSKVSVMPAGLDQQLSARDLADLVAFLRACR
jgi:putative membrane-bound dehydrogenase-like protein